MKIAQINSGSVGGQTKNQDHVVFVNRDEASLFMSAMECFCKQNPKKTTAKKMLRQMEGEFAIF